jgi:hypothetical protein
VSTKSGPGPFNLSGLSGFFIFYDATGKGYIRIDAGDNSFSC